METGKIGAENKDWDQIGQLHPLLPSSNGSGMAHSNMGPSGLPDLNISAEGTIGIESSGPVDLNVGNKNLGRAMALAAQARQRRMLIRRIKKIQVSNNAASNNTHRWDIRFYCISLLILLIRFCLLREDFAKLFFFLSLIFRQYLLIGYLDVNWDSPIIFGLLKEGFYNEMVIEDLFLYFLMPLTNTSEVVWKSSDSKFGSKYYMSSWWLAGCCCFRGWRGPRASLRLLYLVATVTCT